VKSAADPRLVWFAAFCGVAVVAALPAHAQDNQTPIVECKAADLDARFAFSRTADDHESVTIHLKNISQSACLLFGSGPMFNDAKHGHNIWTRQCFECSPEGKPDLERQGHPLTLLSGAEAFQSYVWATVSAGEKAPCQDAGWINTYINADTQHQFLIIAPSLITKVCSDVHVSAFRLGRRAAPQTSSQPIGERYGSPRKKRIASWAN
jgi:hypothetical protein